MSYVSVINKIKQNNDINKLDYRKRDIKKILKDNNLTKDKLYDIINDYKKNIIIDLFSINKCVSFDNLISYLKELKIKELLKLIKDYNLPIQNNINKSSLLYKMIEYLQLYYTIKINNTKLIKIQSLIRGFIIRSHFKYQGDCLMKRSLSLNKEDFYTCDNIKDISLSYFFSYKDKDNFYYSYDIRSFQKLLDYKMSNPYNRYPIHDNVKQQYLKRLEYLERNNIKLIEDEYYTLLTEEQIFRDKVLTIFQKMNDLGHYTDINWFFNLSIQQLKRWYKELEDIFNYRANLTIEQKKKIIPDNKSFQTTVIKVFHNNNKNKVRKIVLNEISRFISLGNTREDRYTGSLYILTAFTIVSQEVADCIPWLVQI